MTLVTISEPEIRAALLEAGFGLGASQFTFSIPTAGSTWPRYDAGSEPFTGFSVLNSGQAGIFRAVIGLWDALIAPNFVEVADDATSRGELRAAFSQIGATTAAYAYSGNPQLTGGKVGDVWINNTDTGDSFARGTYGYEVLIHEVGHTLGLRHPFDAPTLPAAFENSRYSVMSYTIPSDGDVVTFALAGNSLRASTASVLAVTPMVLDIFAVQDRYGADRTTRTGHDVYRFDQNERVLQSIYDAGGNDTIDLSNFTRPNTIDLRPGSYSSIGEYGLEAQIADWSARFPQSAGFIRQVLTGSDLFTNTDNLGIAFTATIENAIGGSAADRITGNAAANILDGRGGDDVLTGGAGADLFRFGASASGNDRITDFAVAEDRFDLGGGVFTAVTQTADGARLTYAGGTIQLDGAPARALAEWNVLVGNASAPTPTPTPTPPATSPAFFLLVPAGAAASVQGSGTVFGTAGGTQQVSVLDVPGRISFDGSFNAGGDRILLAGPASRYTVTRSGAATEISDGDTSIVVPIGSRGTDIVFGDGVRTLIADTSGATPVLRLGAQVLTSSALPITTAAGPATASGAASADVSAQLLVNAGAAATVLGKTTVFGTVAGAETVRVAPGASVAFDGSFNAGGDTIVLPGASAGYTAARSGAALVLSGGGAGATIPLGTQPLTVVFDDGARTARFDVSGATPVLRLGDTIVTTAPVAAEADFATFTI